MCIRLKRIYETPIDSDGGRILVDRLWPRGISKQEANISLRLKNIAPSTGLRKWYGHTTGRWEEFRRCYLEGLEDRTEELGLLRDLMKRNKCVTLVYSARDTEHNQAVVLQELLTRQE
jgi:uncharacterized protein YeaO (DUF488 family)